MTKPKPINLSSISTPDLQAELARRGTIASAAFHRQMWDDNVAEIAALSINGVTSADFVVECGDPNGVNPGESGYDPRYSFSIRHGRKDYDAYYGMRHGNPQKWWPANEHGDTALSSYDNNRALEFVPLCFAEACENSYEYEGTVEEAMNILKRCGFTRVIRRVWERD